jgi:hypothetical protein
LRRCSDGSNCANHPTSTALDFTRFAVSRPGAAPPLSWFSSPQTQPKRIIAVSTGQESHCVAVGIAPQRPGWRFFHFWNQTSGPHGAVTHLNTPSCARLPLPVYNRPPHNQQLAYPLKAAGRKLQAVFPDPQPDGQCSARKKSTVDQISLLASPQLE